MSETCSPIIEVQHLRATYGPRVIFENVSFDVYSGEVLGILGGSGCGKSTLLKHMIGLYAPASGEIRISGRSLNGDDEWAWGERARTFGVTYQSGALFGSMTLLQNVRLVLEEFTSLPNEAMDEIAASKLRLVQLEGFEGHYPAEISGGMKKRAAIARAMALDPRILFLDEPSAGLDPITSAELDQTLLQLRQVMGVTLVVVTHELDSVFAIVDRALVLDRQVKGILAVGAPTELRDHAEDQWVRRFFRRGRDRDVPEATP